MEKIMTPEASSEKTNWLTKKNFSMMIEDTVRKTDLGYLDSILHLCEENKIELEDVKKYLNDNIKQKLEVEAMNLNFIPKVNTLDV